MITRIDFPFHYLWASTAIFVTFDEGGGFWDSGTFVPLDFFGDGPRIPMIVVSPYSTGGNVVHSYNDHASIVKFIERNWGLDPLTERSRDNRRNPKMDLSKSYVPVNAPAVVDLFDMFDFGDFGDGQGNGNGRGNGNGHGNGNGNGQGNGNGNGNGQ